MNGNAIYKIVIFLVNGTWAKDPEWTKDNSDLVKGIRKRFALLSVNFIAFPGVVGKPMGSDCKPPTNKDFTSWGEFFEGSGTVLA